MTRDIATTGTLFRGSHATYFAGPNVVDTSRGTSAAG
jgi:hypothetical protein